MWKFTYNALITPIEGLDYGYGVPAWPEAAPMVTAESPFEQWRRVVAAVKIDGGLPVFFKVERISQHQCKLIRGMKVRDVNGQYKGTIDVSGYEYLMYKDFVEDDDIVQYLFKRAQELFQHELEEQFTVLLGGKAVRRFDPHTVMNHPVAPPPVIKFTAGGFFFIDGV